MTSTITTTDGTVVVTSASTTVFVEVLTVVTSVTSLSTSFGFVLGRAVSTVAGPACATSTYAPSKLSSACSCLGVTPSTTYVTATATPSTSVAVSTRFSAPSSRCGQALMFVRGLIQSADISSSSHLFMTPLRPQRKRRPPQLKHRRLPLSRPWVL